MYDYLPIKSTWQRQTESKTEKGSNKQAEKMTKIQSYSSNIQFRTTQVGLYRIADFTIRPNKNNLFYYSTKYEYNMNSWWRFKHNAQCFGFNAHTYCEKIQVDHLNCVRVIRMILTKTADTNKTCYILNC